MYIRNYQFFSSFHSHSPKNLNSQQTLLTIMGSRSMSKSKKNKQPEQQPLPKVTGPITTDKSGNIIVQVLAKPGAKINSITSIDMDGVGVQISARPIDGEANVELLKYLSSILYLKKSDISLDKGSKSRQKTVLITSKDLTSDEVLQRLTSEMPK